VPVRENCRRERRCTQMKRIRSSLKWAQKKTLDFALETTTFLFCFDDSEPLCALYFRSEGLVSHPVVSVFIRVCLRQRQGKTQETFFTAKMFPRGGGLCLSNAICRGLLARAAGQKAHPMDMGPFAFVTGKERDTREKSARPHLSLAVLSLIDDSRSKNSPNRLVWISFF
jgi:hypothetical protein